jgi:hypothetical protein
MNSMPSMPGMSRSLMTISTWLRRVTKDGQCRAAVGSLVDALDAQAFKHPHQRAALEAMVFSHQKMQVFNGHPCSLRCPDQRSEGAYIRITRMITPRKLSRDHDQHADMAVSVRINCVPERSAVLLCRSGKPDHP